jgi:decaprenylphospho-beta-D-erythro-pentofuranosid-2-ulose 2-reductase
MQHNDLKHYVLVGATSAMAQQCARLWVGKQPARLTLVGRDAAKLQAIADDLRVRSPQSIVAVLTADFATPDGIAQCVQACVQQAPIDVALVAHGVLSDQAVCEQDLHACAQSLNINGVSPVLFAEAMVQAMLEAGGGTLAVIGSVAGDRGRKSNYVYGAAKGLVDRYLQGLQHRLAHSPVRVVRIKPGPTDTPMTADLKALGRRMASVEQVAADIVRGIDQGQEVVYTPGIWRLIMAVVQHIPSRVFAHINI